MNSFEINFDGLIGPTHHYGGLSTGNLASQAHRHQVSHPRAAALQGLAKMKLVADLGIPQAVLPPQPRPHWKFLHKHGYSGTPREVIERVFRERPDLLSIAYSSASMWAANAATVSPSADTTDGRVHLTPANLISTPHRSLESEQTTRVLRSIFHDHRHFVVYDPLPGNPLLADEGAANQMRLCHSHGTAGLEIFVYGKDPDHPGTPQPQRFPARQSRMACERIATMHDVPEGRRYFLQQNPEAIDAGAFHNDVVAVANQQVLLCHARAFLNQSEALQNIRESFGEEFVTIEVPDGELSLADAVSTYLFNSQLLTLPQGKMLLLCPSECESHPRARSVIDRILTAENPIQQVRFVDVRESMRNGGGPACLRLRAVLNEAELSQLGGNILLTDSLYEQLTDWVRRHYREELTLESLGDPHLVEEVDAALQELSQILELPLTGETA